MSFQSFWKPSRLTRTVQHWTRRMESQRQREQRARADAAAWAAISQQVRTRDRQTCRVCGSLTTRWGLGDPRRWGQAHHLVYRYHVLRLNRRGTYQSALAIARKHCGVSS